MIDFVKGKIRSKKKRIKRKKRGGKRKDQNDILEHAAASDKLMTRNKRTGVGLESTTNLHTPVFLSLLCFFAELNLLSFVSASVGAV